MPRLIIIIAITILFLDIVVSRPRLKRDPDFEPIHLFVDKLDDGENYGNNGEQLPVAGSAEQNNIDTPIRYDDGPLYPRDIRVSGPADDNNLANNDETRLQMDNGGLYPSNLQTNETDESKLNETKEKPSTEAPVRIDDGPLYPNDNQLQHVEQNENTDPNYNETPTRLDNGGLYDDLELNRPENLELDNENKDLNQVGDDTRVQIDNGGLYPSNLQTNETDEGKLNETIEQPSTDAPVRFDDGPHYPNDNQLQHVEQNENTDPSYNDTPTRFDNGGLNADLELNRPENLELDNENKDLNQVGDDTRVQIDNVGLYPSNLQTNETDEGKVNETIKQPSTDAPVRIDDGPHYPHDNKLQHVEQIENTDPSYNDTPTQFGNGGLNADLQLNRPENLELDNENKDLDTNQISENENSDAENNMDVDNDSNTDKSNENDNNEDIHSSITDIYGDEVDKVENDDIDSNADDFNGMRMKRFINQFEEDDELIDSNIDDDKNNDISGNIDTNASDLNDDGNNSIDSDIDLNADVSDVDDTNNFKVDDTENFDEDDIGDSDEDDIDDDNIDDDDIDEDDINVIDIDEDDINENDIDEDDTDNSNEEDNDTEPK